MNGSFWGGSLPARACLLFLVPPASLAAAGGQWKPWWEDLAANLCRGENEERRHETKTGKKEKEEKREKHRANRYRNPNAAEGAADLEGALDFTSLQLRGDFVAGDVVVAGCAGAQGAAADVATGPDGRDLAVAGPVVQAFLYVNTHHTHVHYVDRPGTAPLVV